MRKFCHIPVAALAVFAWAMNGLAAVPSPGRQAPPTQPQAAPAQKPAPQPPPGSPPLLRYVQIDFPTQGGASVIDADTYLYFLRSDERVSRPSDGVWQAYDEQVVLEDFRRLWDSKFLDNLWIEVKDAPYENGVMGKHVIFNLEERQRVKIVDYVGSTKIDQTKIDEKLKEENARITLDSFVDPSLVKKVKTIVQGMLAEKGFQYATVTPEVRELPGGPKLIHLSFKIDEGPKVKLRNVQFVGNRAVSGGALKRQMKSNKAPWFFSFLLGKGTYQEAKFEEDADKVLSYFRNHGYVAARVGDPELKVLEDSKDRRTRWVQLRIPVSEGQRYRVGTVDFNGNTIVKTEALQTIFAKLKPGRYYSDKVIQKAFEKARDLYGSVGYFEFTVYPDIKPRAAGGAAGAGESSAAGAPAAAQAEAAAPPVPAQPLSAPAKQPAAAGRRPAQPLVDITMMIQEGKQYFVNRVTFTGNTNTRDNVVRRELRVFEGGVFNTEALKYSIKRVNQLAYFKPLEGGKDVVIDKTPGVDNKVDITLKFEEQNRNQVTFGAGISQYEGFFGQLMYQTANFLGRGEVFSVSLQAGSRAQNYQVAFTEPFLFDRNLTGGIDIYKRQFKLINAYTQDSLGGNLVLGFPLGGFTRMFINYSYEKARVKDINEVFLNPNLIQYNPYLADALLLTQGGVRTISKITPSIVQNTIDDPISPKTGHRYSASIDLAGIGGNTSFYNPTVEGIWYFKHTSRTSVGLRGQFEYISSYKKSATALPIFELLALGGEYTIRGFDIRTIGPKAAPVVTPQTYFGVPFFPAFVPGEVSVEPTVTEPTLVVGGNKSLLFNAEYLISIAGPVRLVLFFDAGQALAAGQRFAWKEFRASTGSEVRFFMPVLNVPFRLIFAYNPLRDGILDNNYQPAKRFTFKFAVGSTF